MGRSCIGCGYCCRKAPCSVAMRHGEVLTTSPRDQKPCSKLVWDGSRWNCGLYEKYAGEPEVQRSIAGELAFGEGCCSGMNTYQVYQHVPTPYELEDEPFLLKMLIKINL